MTCGIDQKLYDDKNNLIYTTYGSLCQIGVCCPCISPVEFRIKNHAGGQDGKIIKIFNGIAELCCAMNRFKVIFPTDAQEADKTLLIGAAMLLDIEYFEQNKNKG